MTSLAFQVGLNDLFNSTGFYFENKVIEVSHKGKNSFLIFGHFFFKMYILEVVGFFSCLVVIESTQFFSGSTYL